MAKSYLHIEYFVSLRYVSVYVCACACACIYSMHKYQSRLYGALV
jgi:hypothetical protein